MHRARDVGTGISALVSTTLSEHLGVFTNPKVPWTPSSRVFMEASLHRHD